MNTEDNLNEERNEAPRRRRRSERHYEEDGLPEYSAPETAEETAGTDNTEEPVSAELNTERPVPESADAGSRVPREARRMTAAPYGEDGAAVPRRPGTRPATAVRRPAPEPRPVPTVRRPIRPEPMNGDDTRSFNTSGMNGFLRSGENGRSSEAPRNVSGARVSVGYAPGRMSLPPRDPGAGLENRDPREARETRDPRTRPEYTRNPRTAQEYVRDIRNAQEYGQDPRRPEERIPRPKKHPVMWTITALLVICGLLVAVLLTLPEGSDLRDSAGDIARTVTKPVEDLLGKKEEPAKIYAFSVTGNEKTIAPADVIFSVTTDSSVKELRLTDEDGVNVGAEATLVENSDSNIWTLTFRVRDGYEGIVKLQTRKPGREWADTAYSETLEIAPPLAATETPVPEETPAETAAPDEVSGDEDREVPKNETPEEETGETAEVAEDPDDPENYGDDMWGVPWGGKAETTPEPTDTPEPTPEPTATPEPTPEPTPTPALTAEAAPEAGPELITTSTIYSGSKKQKSYVRPAKEMIHMPAGDDYTVTKIGVLTFRGNAFRQNAAVGEIESAEKLTQIWSAEAGSSRGASQTFYGYEWTGQPVIVKWSAQVRQASNIDEDKRTKSAMREVIIAGVDGVIRFFDLEDGAMTRGTINLTYPMKGTPSLHPSGYPYMNVGQYTRKMKNKTGSIGLRQYNLYNQKELKLIDGLDGKLHRGINRIGSFETSALIDRTSDTMITLGTNGLLYLVSLNTNFDYQAATLSIEPSTMVLATRAKGEKKDERVAVESSHAMYDKYVFYADMGGVLRCVDTNYLSTVWAIETGDSVMAAVALDLNGNSGLDLYTANMLSIRKTGNAQIRRYDALSGKEIWNVEIGVAKNTKTKEDVGVKASPVIGQHGLSELVYFTVTGLNAQGRETLGTDEETKAAIVALEKETGRIRWSRGLSDRSESSPVAVYDAEGKGYIIQCAEDGTILLLDGLNGQQQAELQVEGKILASPAVYNDIMVIGTSGKGTESVIGIQIK